jgi:hypothetical protein
LGELAVPVEVEVPGFRALNPLITHGHHFDVAFEIGPSAPAFPRHLTDRGVWNIKFTF